MPPVRNARTLIERIVLSKVVEGELRTLDLDMHQSDQGYEIYVFDAEEDFEAPPLYCETFEDAKRMFAQYMDLIVHEPVLPTESVYDFAQRIYRKLSTKAS